LPAYRGALVALLQAHREFQVVTPRTLGKFRGERLVLPNVLSLDTTEQRDLKGYVEQGGRVVILGNTPSGVASSDKTVHLDSASTVGYFESMEKDFATAKPPSDLLAAAEVPAEVSIEAPAAVAANFARVNGEPRVFLANFGGLEPNKSSIPTPAKDIRVKMPSTLGNTLTFLPFLGDAQTLHGEVSGGQVEFVLPPVERGAIVWPGGKN
jgi:hypothetical protein